VTSSLWNVAWALISHLGLMQVQGQLTGANVSFDASVYFRSFTANIKLFYLVTETAVCKQVEPYLISDKPARGVELRTVSLSLNARAKSASPLAVGHQSHSATFRCIVIGSCCYCKVCNRYYLLHFLCANN